MAAGSWAGWRDYEHIWLLDDDIRTSQQVVNDLFDVASGVGLEWAPALDERSYYAHFDMLQNRSFFARWVGFVETMVPGFSRRALELLLPTLDLSETGWGLGLDSVWPKLLDYEHVGVIDALSVTHTRPIGQRRDLAPLDLSREALLVELTCRWEYVFRRDPHVLAWITEYQRQVSRWPPCPVEGTPDRDAPAGGPRVVPARSRSGAACPPQVTCALMTTGSLR